MEESSTSVVGDKHPAIWNLKRDRATKMSRVPPHGGYRCYKMDIIIIKSIYHTHTIK